MLEVRQVMDRIESSLTMAAGSTPLRLASIILLALCLQPLTKN
jgi:hypothetical protein